MFINDDPSFHICGFVPTVDSRSKTGVVADTFTVVTLEADQVSELERRRQAEAEGNVWKKHQRRIHQLKARQAVLKVELANAKKSLGITSDRWSYECKRCGSTFLAADRHI